MTVHGTSAREYAEASDESASAQELRRNFRWFAVQFALNHGVVTTPLVMATSNLDRDAGYMGNALLNIFTVLSAFFLAVPVAGRLGLKRTVLLGMSLYTCYTALFAAAAFVGRKALTAQLVLFSLGSASGGSAAGVLWTTQGSYFSRTVDLVARKESADRAKLTSELAATFAALYLAFEVGSKLTWAALDALGICPFVTASVFVAVGAASTALMGRAMALGAPRGAASAAGAAPKAKAAFALWSDPVVFLLAGLNLTFGFSAAFVNGYINGTFTAKEVGEYAVPLFAASTALVAAIFARIFGCVSMRLGKGVVLCVGSAAFFCIPASFFTMRRCGAWRGWLAVLYLLQGVGRAVYESTAKGLFADFFPNDSTAAFANCMLQTSSAFAMCFFLSSFLTGPLLARISLVLSMLTPLGYLLAVRLRAQRAKAEPQPHTEEAPGS